MRKFVILTAVAAAAVTSLVAMPSAKAGAHHRIHSNFASYPFVPRYAPQYGYASQYGYAPGYGRPTPYRYYDRFGSNLNPDRQMVGIGE